MRHFRALAFVLMYSALILHDANAAGQQPVEDFPPIGDYKLTGTVVNSVTGEPLRRALVTDGVHSVLTDSEGKFEIDGMAKGMTTLDVTKPGFFREGEHHVGSMQFFSNRSVMVGPDTAPITVKLVPGAVIFGRVESNGEPVPNLPLKLMQQQVIEGRRQWVTPGTTSTNDDGEFRLPDLPAGTYYLSAGPSWTQSASLMQSSTQVEQGYPETFYAQAGDLESAAPITVSAGDQTEADFSIKTTRLYKISGTIVGAPAMAANLQFINSAGEVAQFPVHYNPATGGFQTMAPAGAFVLKAQSYAPNQPVMEGSLPLNIGSDVSGIRITLASVASIPIEVRTDEMLPVDTNHAGGGRSPTALAETQVRVELRAPNQSSQNRQYFSTFRGGGDARMMEIQNVEAGQYVADISAGPQWYVESAQCGSVDLLREELTVAAGMQPPPISLVLRNDPGQITGQVSSGGQPAAGAVLVVPTGRPWETRRIGTNSQGNYWASGLAPGEYDVLALDDVEDVEYTNPEVMRQYLPRAQHIVLEPNQQKQLNLETVKRGQE